MRTSFKIPDELIDEFDETWEAEGLGSRSRAVREAMHEYIEAHSKLEEASGEIVGLISFDYAHSKIIEDLHNIQHQYQDVIRTTHHIHQGDWCLESIFVVGDASEIRELVYDLRDFDPVSRVITMMLTKTSIQD